MLGMQLDRAYWLLARLTEDADRPALTEIEIVEVCHYLGMDTSSETVALKAEIRRQNIEIHAILDGADSVNSSELYRRSKFARQVIDGNMRNYIQRL